jgi:GT2 family glycosyltransferase
VKTATTPIALFTYNRPDHTGRALASLTRCDRFDECRIYIYCDGPQGEHDWTAVEASRRVVRDWAEKRGAVVIERQANLGLARSIVTGVSDLCREYGRVIVLEDDLVVSPGFIDYILQALDLYQDAAEVYQISGYMFPVKLSISTDAVFLPLTTTWGWATWERAWRIFDWQATGARTRLADAETKERFDLSGSYPYAQMLENRLAGKNDSWGILWWWAVFHTGGVVLYPRRSLVWVGGFDGSGTHTGRSAIRQAPLETVLEYLPASWRFPPDIRIDTAVFDEVRRLLADGKILQRRSLGTRMWRCLVDVGAWRRHRE